MLQTMWILLIISPHFCHRNQESLNPIVNTNYGKILGTFLETRQEPHKPYYAFRGIPYAKPPLGHLRFQPPMEAEKWPNVLNCTEFKNMCPQISQTNSEVLGDEDCLHLNIYTSLSPIENRPVMFWIHGGAHIRGSANNYGPDYLMEKPIILITVNYRLNIFGFLSTLDEAAHGNSGLKDLIKALKWVQENINYFGGDPNKVTIFGQSSGASCVSLLHLSPQSKGLFHRMIAESGSSLNPRFLQRNPLKYLHRIARYFNVTTRNSESIVKGLREINFRDLTKAANSTKATGFDELFQALPFYPIIERPNDRAIFSKSPYEILSGGNFNKRVSYLIGYNTNDGSQGLKIMDSEMISIGDFDKNHYERFSTQSLNNPLCPKEVGEKVHRFYAANKSETTSREDLAKFFGQEFYVRGLRKSLEFFGKYKAGYFYRFSYKGTHTTETPGVAHGEELQYLFYQPDKLENLTEQDVKTRKRMVELWTNFAITGNPTPNKQVLLENIEWPETRSESVVILDIGQDLLPGSDPDIRDYKFWSEIFANYSIPPLLTY